MSINKMIDHTLLKADATQAEIEKLCAEAVKYSFKSVCVNPFWVSHATKQLKGSDVLVCTVVGFPLGATTSDTKSFETKYALADGATEIDMVINIGALKSGNSKLVLEDVKAVVQAANGKTVKVILETCLLSEQEIILACEICRDGGAHFVKTSTGFSTGGATLENVKLMKQTVPNLEVKASGGIKSLVDAQQMIDAGATRIGTSNGIAILEGLTVKSGY